MTHPVEPLVSVIVPAHNAASFIAAALDSVCAQTYSNLEVLVVDDGSRDRTAQIVREVAKHDARVRLIRQPHQGVGAARNRAIRESRGEYIAPLDADDVWFPRKIAHQVRVFREAKPDVGLIYAWSVYLDEEGRLTGGYYAHELPPHLTAALVFRNFVGCSSVPLIRRTCFEHVGLYNETYAARLAQGCEDLDLYLRIAERYGFALVKEFLVGYRQSARCMSSHTGAMARSFSLVLRDCRLRRPEIPRTVCRWSLARHYFYLHGRARSIGQHWTSLGLLLVAVWFDPSLLLRRPFYTGAVGGLWRRVNGVDVSRLQRGAEHANEGRPEAITLSRVAAARASRPSRLFDVFDALYQRRLRFTEGVLLRAERARSESRLDSRPAKTVPGLGEPRA